MIREGVQVFFARYITLYTQQILDSQFIPYIVQNGPDTKRRGKLSWFIHKYQESDRPSIQEERPLRSCLKIVVPYERNLRPGKVETHFARVIDQVSQATQLRSDERLTLTRGIR